MIEDPKENVIEWLLGEDTVAVTLSQKKFVNKVKKIAEKYPEVKESLIVNSDGTIFANLPLSFIKISPPRSMNMSDEEKARLAQRMIGGRQR